MNQWKFFTDAELTEYYGERCPNFDPGCVVCARWARRDMLLAWEFEDENERRVLCGECV